MIANALKLYSRRSYLVRAGFVMYRFQNDIFVSTRVVHCPTPRVRTFRVVLRTEVDSKGWSARTSFCVSGRSLP